MIDVMRSEWTKLRSVRSTMWTFGVGVLAMIGFGAGIPAALVAMNEPAEMEPVAASLSGVPFAALIFASLGAMVITSEYRTGMMRTSLTAVPQRLKLLASKVLVFTLVALLVALFSTFAAFFLGQAFLGTENAAASPGDPGVLRALLGTALYLTMSGLFGLGIGTFIRHTPGAIVLIVALMMVVPMMGNMLPGAIGEFIVKFFTTNAGQRVASVGEQAGLLGPWQGFGVYALWAAAAMVIGAVLLKRRDA
ncbi:ABC transporter permease subunit [Sinosporangium siamense]|uniref:ABC transporter permease n=1 Tax=Sinosporangium siamense TaxID=1367973 RepID=A0A919RIV8_9ACTN|nr:ABC transporter permease subunit [Sinosporangium siamense]GII93620.1 ABC transporter permease [Sinosporangium siamense]